MARNALMAGLGGLMMSSVAAAQECIDDVVDPCVHPDAVVQTIGDLGLGTTVSAHAFVGAGTELGDGAFLAERSRIEGTSGGLATIAGTGLTLGRRAILGVDVSLGTDATLSRAASIGARTEAGYLLSAGYASTIGTDGIVGNLVTLGALVDIGDDVVIGDGATLARAVDVGDEARVMGILGPEVDVGTQACVGPTVRMRKQARVLDRARVLSGARIGRSAVVSADAVVGKNAVVRAGATVEPGAVVPEDGFVARGTSWSASDGDPGTPVVCNPLSVVGDALFHHNYDDVANPLADSSGSGGDGTGNVTSVSGRGSFSGSQEYSVPSTSSVDWSNGLTVAVWIRWSGSAGNYRAVVNSGYYTAGTMDIRFGRESSGTRLGVATNGPSGQRQEVSVYLPQNEWHHVAMVHAPSGAWTVYLDGVVASSATGLNWMPKSTSNAIRVGNNTFPEPYSGLLDDLYVYNRALTEAEVLALAAEGP